ncbi:hypothetical protein JVU11DRAFT_11444 [Chiua virens]|nr:hypothetical protein JVU11DRAFT_11444 [Chiua virens]
MKLAVTHDNDWIGMLKDGLPLESLMEEGPLRSFMVKKYGYGLDHENNTVYLKRVSEDNGKGSKNCESEPSPEYTEETSDDSKPDDDPKPPSENSRLVITHMRLESFGVEHIDAGVCVLVQFEPTERRTENKSHSDIIEWHDEIVLPSDQSVHVTVCGVFQLGSTLGIREISEKRIINTQDLRSTHKIRFRFGGVGSRSSLLITLERHFSPCETHFIHEEKSVFLEKTALGFDALYTHYRECKPPNSSGREHLETAVGFFRDSLAQCDSTHRATACFNLATSELMRCQKNGIYSELDKAIDLYREALELRGHEDRDRIVSCLGNALLRAIHVRGHLTDIDMSLGLVELGNKVVSKLTDTTAEGTGGPSEQPREQTEWTAADRLLEQLERMPAAEKLPEQMALLCNAEHLWEQSELASASEKLRKQIEPMSAADRALLAIAKQDPSLHTGIPEIQSLLDDWRREDGVPTECKKQLGALLSFLGGEGEIQMREELEKLNLDWCYKDHKISGTVQALEEHAPYFYNELATELGCLMEGWS